MTSSGNGINGDSVGHNLGSASIQDLQQQGSMGRVSQKVLEARRKQRRTLPHSVSTYLKQWLQENRSHPYPTEEQKMQWSKQFDMTLVQVNNWFVNARRRYLDKLNAGRERVPPMHTPPATMDRHGDVLPPISIISPRSQGPQSNLLRLYDRTDSYSQGSSNSDVTDYCSLPQPSATPSPRDLADHRVRSFSEPNTLETPIKRRRLSVKDLIN
ncbi:hypothetical protein MP638_005314 [Amoeboaphelidium occidentale]|nr:hypothetical protein MP638_005314 [Amoeboaphelidium occidentale]